jgi:hypothetical protein
MEMKPGKYDELCNYVRAEADAVGALVMVLDGPRGFGWSCKGDESIVMKLPTILERMAKEIRAAMEKDPKLGRPEAPAPQE